MGIKHTFVSLKSDSPDTTLVRPCDWNASHEIEVSTIATQHLGGDITAVGAELLKQASPDLVRVYIGAGVSDFSGAYSDLTNTTHTHAQYQTVSTLSSAAYTASSVYATAAQGALADTSLQDAGAFDAAGANSTAVAVHVALADPHTQYQMVSSLSSAAYQVTSHFAISSVVVTHVGLADPHTQYQLESGLSSGAFQLSSMYAVSTHAPRHITGGADVIPNFTATASGLVPLSGGGTANFLRADGTFNAPGGGSDPWTYVKVSSTHFGTSSIVFRDIPGLTFTPGTNSSYEFEGVLMMKTSTAAVNPVIGIRWPTNTSSVVWINHAQTNSSGTVAYGNQTSTFNTVIAGALETTTAAWPVILGGVICTYGATASSFAIRMRTESTTVFVSTMINSFLKYRTY